VEPFTGEDVAGDLGVSEVERIRTGIAQDGAVEVESPSDVRPRGADFAVGFEPFPGELTGEEVASDMGTVEVERPATAIAEGDTPQIEWSTNAYFRCADLTIGIEAPASEYAACDLGGVENERASAGIA